VLRVLIVVVAVGACLYFAPTLLTKENLIVLVVGVLTAIGLLRVLMHETLCASNEMFPALTRIAESYYAFRRRLVELKAESNAALPNRSG
jgi:hypothetical protein